MNNEQIKKTIEHFKEEGIDIRVRDIAYLLLSRMFDDSKTAYQCLFGQDGFDEYVTDEMRDKMEEYLEQQGFIKSFSTDKETGGITFKENRSAMEQMIKDIQMDMQRGKIERKDGYARMESIRTKLNDKFNVEAAQKDRMIIVERKFDFVCPHTRRECYQLDKMDAMKKWNLIENPNNNGND